MTSYSIVQIQAFKFFKGDRESFDYLSTMVPSHGSWETLTVLDSIKLDDKNCIHIELGRDYREDSTFIEDVIGLNFISSVGDWPDGYASSFDYDIDMVGINEVVESSLRELMKDIELVFNNSPEKAGIITLLTLWETKTWQDHEGEWNSYTDYLGVFDIKQAQELINND